MAKIIKYKFLVNRGTEENPDMQQMTLEKSIICRTKAQYEANLSIAEKEAIDGTLDPDTDGVFDSEESTEAERITQLEEALELLLSGVTE